MNGIPARWQISRGLCFATLFCLPLLMWCNSAAFAQQVASQASNSAEPFRIRATHILGFEGVPNNANGIISVVNGALRFQKEGGAGGQIEAASVQDLFLGTENRQVGGLPMTLGKAAAPYGGGRVISLFAHKKYDTLTLEYIDVQGGVHGAIFQMQQGQAEVLKNELLAHGAQPPHFDDESKATKGNIREVPSEKE